MLTVKIKSTGEVMNLYGKRNGMNLVGVNPHSLMELSDDEITHVNSDKVNVEFTESLLKKYNKPNDIFKNVDNYNLRENADIVYMGMEASKTMSSRELKLYFETRFDKKYEELRKELINFIKISQGDV